jgi:phospho-N-acetylmuramoyl-pentapeptide-transferase
MLYKLIYFFQDDLSWLNVFRYITFRTILSTLSSLLLLFLFGEWAIQKLRAMQVGQHIREDGPPDHKIKAGTPTMGGWNSTISMCGWFCLCSQRSAA